MLSMVCELRQECGPGSVQAQEAFGAMPTLRKRPQAENIAAVDNK